MLLNNPRQDASSLSPISGRDLDAFVRDGDRRSRWSEDEINVEAIPLSVVICDLDR